MKAGYGEYEMKKRHMTIIMIVAVFAMLWVTAGLSNVRAEAAAGIPHTGPCGPDVTWTLTEDGVLRISGRGEVQLPADESGQDEYYWLREAWKSEARELVIEEGITAVGPAVFRNCEALSAVSIPESVTCVGDYAFANCGMEEIIFPAQADLGESVLVDCINLRSVTLPVRMTQLPADLFGGCGSLQEIRLPKTLKSIGPGAFYGCSSLKEIRLPDGVTQIEAGAFGCCNNLQKCCLPESLQEIGAFAFFGCSSLGDINIPENTRIQGKSTFTGCEALADEEGFVVIRQVLYGYYGRDEEVTVPDGVERIEDRAFLASDITGIVIPEGVRSIGRNAFLNCESLRTAVIPASCSDISAEAFSGTGLEPADRPRAIRAASKEKSSRIVNIVAASNVLLALHEDGTVSVAAASEEGDIFFNFTEEDFEDTAHWTDIVDLVYSDDLLAGLRSDGTVCALSLSAESDWFLTGVEAQKIAEWSEIARITAGAGNILGIRKDGSFVFAGGRHFHLPKEDFDQIYYWSDLKKIEMGTTPEGVYAYALKNDGKTVLYTGCDIVSSRFGEVGEITDLVNGGVDAYLLDSEGRAALCREAAWLAEERMEEDPDYERIIRENLKDLKQITEAGYGLKKDGTVVNLIPDEYDSGKTWLQRMTDVDRLETLWGRFIVGYRSDGSVVMGEWPPFYAGIEEKLEEVNSWTDIVKICAVGSRDASPHFYGLKADGSLVSADGER